jgi:hypothetical protein
MENDEQESPEHTLSLSTSQRLFSDTQEWRQTQLLPNSVMAVVFNLGYSKTFYGTCKIEKKKMYVVVLFRGKY